MTTLAPIRCPECGAHVLPWSSLHARDCQAHVRRVRRCAICLQLLDDGTTDPHAVHLCPRCREVTP